MIYNKGGRHKTRVAARSLTRKRYTISEKVRFLSTVDTMMAAGMSQNTEPRTKQLPLLRLILPVLVGGVDSCWHNCLQAVERICLFKAILLLNLCYKEFVEEDGVNVIRIN